MKKALNYSVYVPKKKTGNPRLFTFSVLHSDLSLEGNELNGSVYHTFWLITEGMTFITSGKSLVLSFTM